MKTCTFAILLGCLVGCAEVPMPEATWQALHVVDSMQTYQIANRECYHEDSITAEPFIGSNPSERDVVVWAVASAALHWAVSDYLHDHGPRWAYVAFESVTIGHSAALVERNHSNGLDPTGSAPCR